jgi:hypothetical protein
MVRVFSTIVEGASATLFTAHIPDVLDGEVAAHSPLVLS